MRVYEYLVLKKRELRRSIELRDVAFGIDSVSNNSRIVV